jgi:hypothetical protein
MFFEATLKYSETIVRRAALASWRHAFGVRFVVALALLGAGLLFLVQRGERSWIVGMLGTVLLLGIAFAAAAYVVSVQSSLSRLRQMQSPEALLRAEASGFSISSELGAVTMPWSAVKRVWRHPGFWLLVLSRSSQVTLPLAAVAEEAQSFILQQIKGAGGRVGG